jgi:plastocyanin
MLRQVLMVAGIVAAAGCGGGGGSSPTENKTSPPPGSAGVVSVQVGDNFFNPQSVRVEPGQTVQWTLVGQMTNHTVTDTGGAFDSGFLSRSGATFSHTFGAGDSGRTFNYQCQTHASLGMKGAVQVGSNAPPPNPGY